MDNNNKMMVQQLMQEEVEAVAESKKHHLLITALHLRARLQPPQTRGSRKEKSKDRPTSRCGSPNA
jgi:hypothetical protein